MFIHGSNQVCALHRFYLTYLHVTAPYFLTVRASKLISRNNSRICKQANPCVLCVLEKNFVISIIHQNSLHHLPHVAFRRELLHKEGCRGKLQAFANSKITDAATNPESSLQRFAPPPLL